MTLITDENPWPWWCHLLALPVYGTFQLQNTLENMTFSYKHSGKTLTKTLNKTFNSLVYKQVTVKSNHSGQTLKLHEECKVYWQYLLFVPSVINNLSSPGHINIISLITWFLRRTDCPDFLIKWNPVSLSKNATIPITVPLSGFVFRSN